MKATRKTMARAVSQRMGVSISKATPAVNAVIDCLFASLAGGKKVEIRGFGVLRLVARAAQVARNPKRPDELYEIPAHNRIVFTPTEALRKAVVAQPLVQQKKLASVRTNGNVTA